MIPTSPGGPVFTRCADATALAQAGAGAIAAAAGRAIALHGEFRLALSGGRTPQATYAELARQPLDWERVAIFFSDERCVPPDHGDSNYGHARRSLLAHVPLPGSRVHRIQGELPPDDAAARYEALLRQQLETGGRTFDLCLLGLGSDGHCASLFPGLPAGDEPTRLAVATAAPPRVEPRWRVTATLPCIAASEEVLFLVAGTDKASVVSTLQRGEGDRYPAGRVRARGRVRYLVAAEAWGETEPR